MKLVDVEKLVSDFLKNIPENKIPLIVILGPTASGKTALSVDLAQAFDGEIISADSRQIYRTMNIGTAKITEQEMRGVPHYMIDIADPDEIISLYDYRVLAENLIKDIFSRGRIPFLVGGTGLYIRAITDNYEISGIAPNPELRNELEILAKEKGVNAVWERLNKLNPIVASSIHPNNLRYVIRGIEKETYLYKNPPLLNSRERGQGGEFHVLKLGIEWGRDILYDRINKRVEEQVEMGLIDETKMLFEKYDPNLPSMSGLGYPQIYKFINGELTLEEAKDLLKKETRHYAKRQLTWFSKEKDVNWIRRDNS